MIFAEQIKDARKRLGLNQKQTAMAVSPLLPTRTLQGWEQGISSPPPWAQHMILDRLELARFETPHTIEFRARLRKAMDDNDPVELQKLWREGIDAYENPK